MFVDRERELDQLSRAWDSSEADLVLLYGRRRIGKTYLLQHFLSDKRPHCYFLASAMAIPDNVSHLAEALIAAHPRGSGMTAADFPTLRSLLQYYGEIVRETRFALVLDEFQYLVSQDPSIPSQIQAWWDTVGIRSQGFVVLCGSQVGMMESLAVSNQPLYGRFTVRQQLQPMTYDSTALFYENLGWSTRDKMTAYGVLGGTPKYHALFADPRGLDANIIDHLLSPDGSLRDEPDTLICSSSIRDPAFYNSMLHAVASGETRRSDIEQRAGITHSQFGFYARNLMELGWMSREIPFGEDSGKRSIYKITDHFIHFWYRFVSTLASELEFRDTTEVYETRVKPYLNDYMGRYVFEDVCMQYLKKKASSRHGLQIRDAGRYWSRNGSVEIDILGDLLDGRTLACECKWSSSPIDAGAYYDLMRKVHLLPPPRGTGLVRYVIFSASGFDDTMLKAAARDDVVLVSGDDMLAGIP